MNQSIVLAIDRLRCFLAEHLGTDVDLTQIVALLTGIKADLENSGLSAAQLLSAIEATLTATQASIATTATNTGNTATSNASILANTVTLLANFATLLVTEANILAQVTGMAFRFTRASSPKGFTTTTTVGQTLSTLITSYGSSYIGTMAMLSIYNADTTPLSINLNGNNGAVSPFPMIIPVGQRFTWNNASGTTLIFASSLSNTVFNTATLVTITFDNIV